MKLDRRLRAITDEIAGDALLDVGCDHGKVLVAALREGRVSRATGVDISEKSLKKARILADEAGVKAEFVVGDGRDVPFGDHDVLVIAGMGGEEIVEILKGRDRYPETLVLVPHQGKDTLRSFLNEIKLYPAKDFTVESAKHFYEIIVIKGDRGGAPYTAREIATGKNLPATDAFIKKAEQRVRTLYERIDRNPVVSAALKEELEAYLEWLR